MRRWFDEHRATVGFLILAAGVLAGFQAAHDARSHGQRLTCQALREDRALLSDVVNVAIPPATAQQPELDPALPDSVRSLIAESRKRSAEVRQQIERRLEQPIALCEGTGINPTVRLGAARWSGP